MCGIVGWFSRHPIEKQSGLAVLKTMTATIGHRGPDGDGTVVLENCALGHRRLSIIDLENGAQPLQKQHIWISFNGEIFNYRALKTKLENTGSTFVTQSDTEIIVELYRQYGVDGFTQLRGMFAFAIWNDETKVGHLVRDPLGIKPLFFAHEKFAELVFASEAKSIVAKSPHYDLNTQALHLLLNFRYLPTQDSLFKGIRQIAPGEIVTWHQGDVSSQRFTTSVSFESDNTLDILQDSVSHHLVSDVEVAAYLSGGIDSGLLTALMSSELSDKSALRTFTVDIGDDPNEMANAQETADFLNVTNVPLSSKLDAQNNLTQLVWHLEVPKINSLQSYVLASKVSKYSKVAISGLGGDELFLGYNAHKWMGYVHTISHFSRYLPSTGSNIQHAVSKLSTSIYSERNRAILIALNATDPAYAYGLLRNVWDMPHLRREIYGERMLDENLPNAFDLIRDNWNYEKDPVMAMRDFEWNHKLINDLLWQEDRCSMAHGLEVRVPFVDSTVKHHVWQLSQSTLQPGGELKGLLKSVAKRKLSSEIINRRKSGFQVDSPVFFDTELRALAEQYLCRKVVEKHQIFNFQFIQRLLANPLQKKYRWHFFMLYLMVGTHIWLELFEKPQASFG